MNNHEFKFYINGNYVKTITFNTQTIEEAYKKADNVLRQNPKYDDWEYITNEIVKTNK